MNVQALHRALLSAFPSAGELELMLRTRMNVKLAEIASGNLSDQTLSVIRFAESRGLLNRLLESALAAKPGNPELRAVAAAQPAMTGTERTEPFALEGRASRAALTETGASPVPPPIDKRRLRNIIQESYSTGELELLCADLQEQLRARGHDVRLSLADIGGATKPVQVLNLIEFLDRRRALDVLIQTVGEQRPGRL
jgi:hypothetical protein